MKGRITLNKIIGRNVLALFTIDISIGDGDGDGDTFRTGRKRVADAYDVAKSD